MPKLYMAHCGYYDSSVADGIFEFHTNYFAIAESFDEAKRKVKELSQFNEKRMHVDGLIEINVVDGHRIHPEPDLAISSKVSVLVSNRYRELAKVSNHDPLKEP